MNAQRIKESTVNHLWPAVAFTVVSVIALGVIYPLAMTGIAELVFPSQANGSIVYRDGKPIGSDIIGQLWTKLGYFHGRPSAAGKGYDPTSTGATNLGPTSKKLIDSTRAAIAALERENPNAEVPLPMDLVTSSGSGIDPDISPQGAIYQAPRIARARGVATAKILTLIARHVRGRELGFLGEPRVNVMELNLALDARYPAASRRSDRGR
ncbi:MAG TPA: potassium-transporting ATPase subunit KdpC [Candidatus Dormibacteraeota bacterium]|nr:potassium-transporting ATPase subunit KdpC [Candidatus Dormibacteraeota bacterium]